MMAPKKAKKAAAKTAVKTPAKTPAKTLAKSAAKAGSKTAAKSAKKGRSRKASEAGGGNDSVATTPTPPSAGTNLRTRGRSSFASTNVPATPAGPSTPSAVTAGPTARADRAAKREEARNAQLKAEAARKQVLIAREKGKTTQTQEDQSADDDDDEEEAIETPSKKESLNKRLKKSITPKQLEKKGKQPVQPPVPLNTPSHMSKIGNVRPRTPVKMPTDANATTASGANIDRTTPGKRKTQAATPTSGDTTQRLRSQIDKARSLKASYKSASEQSTTPKGSGSLFAGSRTVEAPKRKMSPKQPSKSPVSPSVERRRHMPTAPTRGPQGSIRNVPRLPQPERSVSPVPPVPTVKRNPIPSVSTRNIISEPDWEPTPKLVGPPSPESSVSTTSWTSGSDSSSSSDDADPQPWKYLYSWGLVGRRRARYDLFREEPPKVIHGRITQRPGFLAERLERQRREQARRQAEDSVLTKHCPPVQPPLPVIPEVQTPLSGSHPLFGKNRFPAGPSTRSRGDEPNTAMYMDGPASDSDSVTVHPLGFEQPTDSIEPPTSPDRRGKRTRVEEKTESNDMNPHDPPTRKKRRKSSSSTSHSDRSSSSSPSPPPPPPPPPSGPGLWAGIRRCVANSVGLLVNRGLGAVAGVARSSSNRTLPLVERPITVSHEDRNDDHTNANEESEEDYRSPTDLDDSELPEAIIPPRRLPRPVNNMPRYSPPVPPLRPRGPRNNRIDELRGRGKGRAATRGGRSRQALSARSPLAGSVLSISEDEETEESTELGYIEQTWETEEESESDSLTQFGLSLRETLNGPSPEARLASNLVETHAGHPLPLGGPAWRASQRDREQQIARRRRNLEKDQQRRQRQRQQGYINCIARPQAPAQDQGRPARQQPRQQQSLDRVNLRPISIQEQRRRANDHQQQRDEQFTQEQTPRRPSTANNWAWRNYLVQEFPGEVNPDARDPREDVSRYG